MKTGAAQYDMHSVLGSGDQAYITLRSRRASIVAGADVSVAFDVVDVCYLARLAVDLVGMRPFRDANPSDGWFRWWR